MAEVAQSGTVFSPSRPADCEDPLPCPFCGSTEVTAGVRPGLWKRRKEWAFRVFCRDCPAIIEVVVFGGYEVDKDQGVRDVVEYWNRRA